MTTRVVKYGQGHMFPGGVKEIIISCDHVGCDVSLNDKQIQDGGGLAEMGWQATHVVDSMKHYCPDHNR